MKTKSILFRPFNGHKRDRGMTLIEIIIVVALLGTLMAILVNNLLAPQQEAQRDQAKLQMAGISQPLNMYRVHHNKYPTSAQGLDVLVSNPGDDKSWRGPYTEETKLTDPWGKKFDYESDGKQFKITSSGPDGESGTADDVVYPDAPGGDSKAPGEGAPEGGNQAPPDDFKRNPLPEVVDKDNLGTDRFNSQLNPQVPRATIDKSSEYFTAAKTPGAALPAD